MLQNLSSSLKTELNGIKKEKYRKKIYPSAISKQKLGYTRSGKNAS